MTGRNPDDTALCGVLTVLATPFDDEDRLDLESLRLLVEHAVSGGSDGVVCFGLASEPYKLDDGERAAVLAAVIAQVSGRVAVIAGTEGSGHAVARRRTEQAFAFGVDAVMVYPPTFVKPDPGEVFDYYTGLAAASPIPVIVQDAPAWTGVPLPVDLLRRIRDTSPNVSHVKVENPPSAGKMARLVDDGFACIAGYGALHLPEECAAGATAVMPGCALPSTYVRIWQELQADPVAGWRAHAELLPLLAFQMSSLDTFVAVQKHLLHRAGVIASPRVRPPGRQLSDTQTRWLDTVLDRLPAGADLFPAQPSRTALETR